MIKQWITFLEFFSLVLSKHQIKIIYEEKSVRLWFISLKHRTCVCMCVISIIWCRNFRKYWRTKKEEKFSSSPSHQRTHDVHYGGVWMVNNEEQIRVDVEWKTWQKSCEIQNCITALFFSARVKTEKTYHVISFWIKFSSNNKHSVADALCSHSLSLYDVMFCATNTLNTRNTLHDEWEGEEKAAKRWKFFHPNVNVLEDKDGNENKKKTHFFSVHFIFKWKKYSSSFCWTEWRVVEWSGEETSFLLLQYSPSEHTIREGIEDIFFTSLNSLVSKKYEKNVEKLLLQFTNCIANETWGKAPRSSLSFNFKMSKICKTLYLA